MGSVPESRRAIRGEHVYLRAAERSDLETFVRWLNDADVTDNLAMFAPMSLAAEEAWFERMLAAQGTTDYHWVICLLEDDRAIGSTGLHRIDPREGTAEFGIFIGVKGEWGRGHATDALRAVCDFGFGELRLERIGLMVYEGNDRGRRAYEKAGFVHEGTMRKAHYARGERHDVHVMGLLRSDWEASGQARAWER